MTNKRLIEVPFPLKQVSPFYLGNVHLQEEVAT